MLQLSPGARRALTALAFITLMPGGLAAQQRAITIDDLYDPDRRADLAGSQPTGLAWLDDASYVWPRPADDAGVAWTVVDATRGTMRPLFDAAKMEAAFAALPGIGPEEAARLPGQRRLQMNPARTAALVAIAGDLYHYEFSAGRVARLTTTPEEELDPTFSPDGRLVAFTRANDLFVVEVGSGRERRLTTDGNPKRLNGRLDWVYQEEIYGRGNYRAFWWSPDSRRLAFLQLDETAVPTFTLVDHIPLRQDVEVFEYPKPGDPNPAVRLGTVGAAGGPVQWVDTNAYSAGDHLIVNVAWTPDSTRVVYSVQDREQTWLDLRQAQASTGAGRTLLRETTKAWVDNHGDPKWLVDGSFLWFSERSGWKHLYHYQADGSLVRQVTDGPWEVRTLYGVDEPGGWIYFAGTERSHIGGDVYRVRIDGSDLTRLSQPAGTHSALFNPSFSLYIGTRSDIATPPQTRLHRADGTELRVIDENRITALSAFRLVTPEFLQVETRDGFEMEAMLIKPPDFDPARRYPVFQHTYAGPHAPQVRNAWGGVGHLYLQMLAQQGIVVWVCDNRSASGKGAESAWHAYLRLGITELEDIEDGLAWLRAQPWVDASRIGINGWSYGGFMTSFALTHSTSFAMGIAGGSVTDWTLYDSIYTERFMRMPQHNAEGYEKTSVVRAAKDLHGALLLIHGTMDDNVHVQNTVALAYELQRAGKPFELMLYPKSRHGVTDPRLVKHMRQAMFDFTMKHLRPEGATTQ